MKNILKDNLEKSLKQNLGCITWTAKDLLISRQWTYYLIKKYGIDIYKYKK